jgi:hypothetical protein
LVESSIILKSHRLNHRAVGECHLSLANNNVRRLSVLWTTAVQRDGLTVALDVQLVVELTRTTPVNDETTPSRLLKTR